jgi:hypothetical protein
MHVDTSIVIVAILLVVVVALLGFYVTQRQRSGALRKRFGPEYERTVQQTGDRRQAEAELEGRTQRVSELGIRPLEPAERDQFAGSWRTVQAQFVDEPEAAVQAADALVMQVMEARGYPVGDFDQRAADVSVDHPHVVDHYRVAHRIAHTDWAGDPDTEQLRQAMVHYRALFSDLLDTPETDVPAADAPAAPAAAPVERDTTPGTADQTQGAADEGAADQARAHETTIGRAP